MAVFSNRVLSGLRYPSGPVESRPLMIARGQVDLDGAGLAVENVPGFPAGATVICSYNAPVVTVGAGELEGGYDSVTGHLSIDSNAGAAAAGARVNWILVYF